MHRSWEEVSRKHAGTWDVKRQEIPDKRREGTCQGCRSCRYGRTESGMDAPFVRALMELIDSAEAQDEREQDKPHRDKRLQEGPGSMEGDAVYGFILICGISGREKL